MITQEQANHLFEYRDGILHWRVRPTQSRKLKGDTEAGSHSHGYKKVTVEQKTYYVHQIVFLMHHGYIPKIIDHIDQDKCNNKIENLRAANKAINSLNRPLQPNNKSGHKGIFWNTQKQKWQASLYIMGKRIHCGFFEDINLAGEFVTLARQMAHGSLVNTSLKGI
jgi:hypothetical protein